MALRRVDWVHAPGWVIHVSVFGGALAAAVATHDTGGAGSPARFLLMLVLVFAAYFFPAREAWPYLGIVLLLAALPFAYDGGALDAGLLGELLIVAPCYWLLAFLLITGKRGMITLRSRADTLARQDPLTGLANRRALLEAMHGLSGRIGLLMLDVDDFKATNTRFGHPGGDRALVSSPTACAARAAPATCPRGSAATSSRSWSAASTRRAWRRWPIACWARSATAARCASAPAGSSARTAPISC